jgi:hypothetical protein
MAVADVLLFARDCVRYRAALVEREPPLTKAIEVAPGIQLAGVKEDVARAVFHGCKFRELEPDGDVVMYGFVRYDPPGGRWDEDQAISQALYLSHFLHAHDGGFEFAARIETDERRRLVRLEPADIAPSYARAYPCPGVQRRWLTQSEGKELNAFIHAYNSAREYLADKRVGTAVSLFADSPFVYQGRPRAALLAAILEGLVSTSPDRALKQFVVRVPALAAEVGLPEFDRSWADRMYKLRSKLAHGVPLFHSPEESHRRAAADDINEAMRDMDELLRRLLRRALLDRDFAERIHNVDTHWPVAGKACAVCLARDPTLSAIQCPRCGSTWKNAD